MKTFQLLSCEGDTLLFLDEETYDQWELENADLVWGQTDDVLQFGARYLVRPRDDARWDIAFLEYVRGHLLTCSAPPTPA